MDSKNLYHVLSSKRNTIEKSVTQDVNSISYYFETSIDVIGWMSGSLNIAEVSTKQGSEFTYVLILTLAAGMLQVNMASSGLNKRDKSYG